MASAGVMASPSPIPPSPSPPSHRQSFISSSATSFKTAPLSNSTSHASGSHSSSRSSSAHTLPVHRDLDGVNPIHTLSSSLNGHTGEVHIVKVTGDTVQVETGPVTDSFLKKVGKSLTHAMQTTDADEDLVGPPPPSPPASIDHIPGPEIMHPSQSEPGPSSRPIIFDEPEPMRHQQRQPSLTASTSSRLRSSAHDPSFIRSSTDTITFTKSSSFLTGTTESTEETSDQFAPSTSSSKNITAHLSTDGYLQPPPVTLHHRPARRNTTGSSPRTTTIGRTAYHHHAQFGSSPQPFAYDDAEGGDGELASDIQLHADRIRRERMSKRVKQQQEAEAALTRSETNRTTRGSTGRDEVPLVGNLIGEDHVNYVLMYNMLTGIRIGVSRCQAKIKRPLTDDDFTARHKYSFDLIGNELTPSAKYDFKFKDYAPWVFRELREDYFHLDPADYLLSLTSKYILSELGSPGKSGSFFYFSRDYRFIIKTIRHSEHKFLLSILKEYHAHIKSNPHTLLSRFYGLHRVKLPRGRKIHFVIMNNLFPPHRDIHETFDLKGSTVGREYSEEKAAANPRAVLKDLNWIGRGKMLELGPEKRALLTEQLRRDSEFLKKIDVMDYSLLVGIHNMVRGNRDNVRRNTLKVFSPDIQIRRHNQLKGGGTSPEAIATMRRAMRESDPKRLGKSTIRLPEEDTGDRQHFIFYQDEGGLRATDEGNEPLDTIYYLGVIDILTPYSVVKRLEHFWKGLKADRHKISPVPPTEYADRFFAFMKAIMRGGGGGARFKAE